MRSKYGNKKVKLFGHTFDSIEESKYYLILLDKKQRGEILDFELQPKFLLQDKFEKNGVKHRAIHYIADFKVINSDGSIDFIDVKGVETAVFKLKHKLFEYKYPDLSLTIIGGDSNGKAKPGEKKEGNQITTRKKAAGARRNIRKRL